MVPHIFGAGIGVKGSLRAALDEPPAALVNGRVPRSLARLLMRQSDAAHFGEPLAALHARLLFLGHGGVEVVQSAVPTDNARVVRMRCLDGAWPVPS